MEIKLTKCIKEGKKKPEVTLGFQKQVTMKRGREKKGVAKGATGAADFQKTAPHFRKAQKRKKAPRGPPTWPQGKSRFTFRVRQGKGKKLGPAKSG